MERKQTTEEAREFVGLLKRLSESQQIGLCMMIDGMKLIEEKRKRRITRRPHS